MFNESINIKIEVPNGKAFIQIAMEIKYTSMSIVTKEQQNQLKTATENFVSTISKYADKYSREVLAEAIVQSIRPKLKELKNPIRPYEIKIQSIETLHRITESEMGK